MPTRQPSSADPESATPAFRLRTRCGHRLTAVWRGLRADPLVATLAALVALPGLLAVVSASGRDWAPVHDWAIIAFRVSDVGGEHAPLVGMPSRYEWSHPGPALFWVLNPFYRALGVRGVLVGTGLLNVASLGGACAIAYRRAGRSFMVLFAFTAAVLVHATTPTLLVDPWTPWVAVLPFLCFTMLAWSVMCGDARCIPFLVGVGSFVVQTHVGYAPLVAGLGLVAAAWVLTASRAVRGATSGAPRARLWQRPAITDAIVAVVMWAPPVAQQVSGSDGNLSELATFFADPPDPALGLGDAIGVVGHQLSVPAPWIRGLPPDSEGDFVQKISKQGSSLPAFAMLGALLLAAVLARRRGLHDESALAALAAASIVVGTTAVARVTGGAYEYLVRWLWVVALLAWTALAWTATRLVASYLRDSGRTSTSTRAARGLTATVVLATALTAGISSRDALPVDLPEAPGADAVAALAGPVSHALPEGETFLLTVFDSRDSGAAGPGLTLQLDRRGHTVRMESFYEPWVEGFRTIERPDATAEIVVVGDSATGFQTTPAHRLIAEYEPGHGSDAQGYRAYLLDDPAP